jgi:hypothetical protein
MAYCKNCGAYIPDELSACLACGFDESAAKAAAAAAEEKKAKTKEEKQAEREASKREHLLRTAKDEAGDKFDDWTDEHAKDGDWPQWFIDAAVEEMVNQIRDYGSGDLEGVVDKFAANTGFKASDAEADKVYQEYLAEVYKGSGDE